VFKTSGEESLKLLSSQELYRLNDDGKWKKVNSNPVSMPYIEKPLLYKSSNPSYEFTFTNFNGPASKYTDVRWTPVDNKDAKRINDFLDNTEKTTFVCGAIKQLVEISFNENDFSKSLDIIAKAKRFDINSVSKLELKMLKINTLIKMDDLKGAKIEVEKVLNSKNIPLNIEQKINEFEGLLSAL